MCYTDNLNHKGIKIFISNCFGVGFDWNDPKLIEAIKNRDGAIWEIMDWIASGGAKLCDDANCFDEYVIGSGYNGLNYREILRNIRDYNIDGLADNPYLSARAKRILDSLFDGTLAEKAEEQRVRERDLPKHRKDAPGYVYLVRIETGLYKIGKAKNITSRLTPFGVSFPMKWELVHSFKSDNYSLAEASLHDRFSDKRDVGEWFRLLPEEVEEILSIQDGGL